MQLYTEFLFLIVIDFGIFQFYVVLSKYLIKVAEKNDNCKSKRNKSSVGLSRFLAKTFEKISQT